MPSLTGIPFWLRIVAPLALLAGLWFWSDHRGYQRGAGDVQAEWNAAIAEAAKNARALEAANRAEDQRRYAAQQDAIDAKAQELADARRDADDARAAGDELRAYLNRLSATCRPAGDPGATGSGPSANGAADLLADVQRRLDQASEGIARHADESSAAGRACERSYDALMEPR